MHMLRFSVQKTFEETLRTALRTERVHGFRLCIDEKDNISVAKGGPFGAFIGYDNPICPPGTKKTLDVTATPDTAKKIDIKIDIAKKIKQIKDEFPPSYQPDDEEILNDALKLYLVALHPV